MNNFVGPSSPYIPHNLQNVNQAGNTQISNNYNPFPSDVGNKYQVTWDENLHRPIVHSRSRVIICEPSVNCCCNNPPPNRFSVPNQNPSIGMGPINQCPNNQFSGNISNIGASPANFGPTSQFGPHPQYGPSSNHPGNAFSNINTVSCTQPNNYPNVNQMNMNVPQFGPACPHPSAFNNHQPTAPNNNFNR